MTPMAVSCKVWRLRLISILLSLLLLSTSISISQARPLPSSFSNNSNGNQSHHVFKENAKQVLKEIIRRHQLLGEQNYPTRLSPGGPDPHHH
ncbi:CLAVATA3/ESR (CLE)-related protein 1-like [Senna tora]|uniref:CLAVATA3/ESR (CLE)-related protein 1-like n=1 Tax=Senna tora TaxID=362788 RepID=A0A834X2V9_9FABA|nr:CLAVATA3/ESR (CLE)-related protein 1-like [Senna tora]